MPFRRSKASTYSLFFATDLHGSEKCFSKFIKAADFYGVDALVLGGDLTGKVLVPIVERQGGGYETEFLDQPVVVESEDDLVELERNIRFNGHYPLRCTREEYEAMREDKALRDRRFNAVIRGDLERWVARADEHLAERGTPCVAMPGNDDDDYVGDVLRGASHVLNGDERVVELGPFQVLSFGYSNPTPWNSPRELSEDVLLERLKRVARDLEPSRPTVFNVHVPPYSSGLDLAPELGEGLKLAGGATSRMVPVGSTSTRTLIEEEQPLLSLHGHVHESRGTAKVGRTFCVNPGSEYNVGTLRGVIVRLTEDKVVGHQFVAA
jgi:Icc-related predicted phosphoesterase